ncbi:hypothetical protein CEP88_01840 [Roseobacter denitrificans]|uniref:Metal-binding integral membrane protein n=1 Tax=Roseobacter denitrificans (strain ATCC 33942 / OCh 114) TaxID=375451 RepID=Q166Z7_ROSDO|nr:DUF2182 domain-containing protein [Roseobacter denitrificans]ABG31946.1 conserved hypothetical protein [Roseobacter denitrificans OCh 114]AVL51483.1 hypothetical protein CEP88_01840 [Roseobacter denitrificans]SFG35033.1 Predicted metal-binding membrane protein [Roseobacter denitrificans OCh 114]
MTALPDIAIGPHAGRWSGRLIIALIAVGWVYALAQVLTLDTPGSLAQAGPGMAIFAHIKAGLFGDPFAFETALSFCAASTGDWGVLDFLKAAAMWLGMICAMMVPVLLLRGPSASNPHRCSGVAGYVAAWLPFCALAVGVQWALQTADLLSAHALLHHDGLSVAILLGIACLYFGRYVFAAKQTDNDIEGLTSFRAGLALGRRCLPCCGPLMLIMFIIGLMNVVGMLVLTALMVLLMAVRSKELSLALSVGALLWAVLLAAV